MIIKKRSPRPTGRREFIKANHHIRHPQVRVLSERGEMIGLMSSQEAMTKALDEGKDLVLLTEQAQPPVVKIINLAKYRYQLKQKQAESRKKSRKQDLKEIRFSPFIGEGDFETRMKKIVGFLTKGDKVRLTVEFRGGRQLTKKEFGFQMLQRVFAQTQELAEVEIHPKMMGNKLMAQLSPIKKKPNNKE